MGKRVGLKFKHLAIITAAWIAVGVFITVYDHLLLSASLAGSAFGRALLVNVATGFVGALMGGSFMVFFINEKFSDKPYAYTVLSTGLFFLLVVATVSVLKGQLGADWTGSETFVTAGNIRIKNAMIWFTVVCLTQFALQMNSRTLLGSFIRGRYNVPREEKKIFMFLDLNSSTSIAEVLGDEKYHALLRDFFSDIADPVLESNGYIYQYVGDEVIVSWDYAEGIQENRCIQCFYDIKKQVALNSDRYERRYGIVPSFKAGFHCGKVVAGEVGKLKREITYSGDVLNTTARILSMCKDFGAEVIASGSLLSHLCLDKTFEVLQLGSMKLHGKTNEVSLSSVRAGARNP